MAAAIFFCVQNQRNAQQIPPFGGGMEYKAPHVEITQAVFDQITRYNMVLKVDYLIVSNGMQHYCCRMDYENQSYTFLRDIPDYASL